MNQYQWTFLDNAARRHTLGIAHGARSGNLVVHCNAQIVKIDFSVLEPRTYSFFVEDELCHLAIEGTREEGFHYNFHIDTEADTPVNRERNLKRVTSQRKGIAAAVSLAVLVFGFLGGVAYWGWSTKQATVRGELYVTGARATATLLPGGTFEFVGNNRVVSGAVVPQDAKRLAALGIVSLEDVPVRYYVEDPETFVVDWRALFRSVRPEVRTVVPLNTDSATSPKPYARIEMGTLNAAAAVDASPPAHVLLEGLSPKLPDAAGPPACALRAAGILHGFRKQLSLVDTYVVGDEGELRRWTATFKTAAYREALREACPVGGRRR